MYTKEFQNDYDWDGDEMVWIKDPDDMFICLVKEDQADALLSHLNRGM